MKKLATGFVLVAFFSCPKPIVREVIILVSAILLSGTNNFQYCLLNEIDPIQH